MSITVADEPTSLRQQKIDRTLPSPHYPSNQLMQFTGGVSAEARQRADDNASVEAKKVHRHQQGRYAVKVPTATEPTLSTTQKVAAMLKIPHHPTHLLVRFVDATSSAANEAANTAAAAVVKQAYRHVSGLHLVEIPTGKLSDALSSYLDNEDVMYAEPDYPIELAAEPTDEHFDALWGLKNRAQCLTDPPSWCVDGTDCDLEFGISGADIQATIAWDVSTGDQDFKIAVLDQGVNYNHNDFHDGAQSNIWTNPGESGGGKETNGIDDDGNGYVDDVHGYDFADGDGDPLPEIDSRRSPGEGHGSHVAGIIGARANNGTGENGIGVVGVNWECSLVILRVKGFTYPGNEAFVSAAIDAIDYIIEQDIKVSNNSWVLVDHAWSNSLRDAIATSGAEIGHIFVAAANNDGENIDTPGNQVYPASYNLQNIITVGATGNTDSRPAFSNWGPVSVDLEAPGDEIYSLGWPGDDAYTCKHGTSQAAPLVTGAVALIMGEYPTLKSDRVKDRILDSARDVGHQAYTVTGDVLDLGAAMDPDGHDCNDNGIFDECDIDCNADGCDTACEEETQCPCTKTDDNASGIPDGCEIPDGAGFLDRMYVDKGLGSGSNDGSSWANAYRGTGCLQTAITGASDGTEIWVADGDYDPITLDHDVLLYGGFAGSVAGVGGETEASESDPSANVTNIIGNATKKHVVESESNGNTYPTVIRGFHIKDGNANGTAEKDKRGGGMYLNNSDILIVQCTFHDNDAVEYGGAVANYGGGSSIFVNCKFYGNKDSDTSGAIAKGGGFYNDDGAPQFHNCLFYENEAEKGGAVYIADGLSEDDKPTFTNCTIAFNDADDGSSTGQGGGIWDGTGVTVVHNSIFSFNDAHGGSGHEIYNAGTPTTCVWYSNIPGGWTGCGANNISVPARFTSVFGDDYTLRSTSLCIDAGSNTYLPADAVDLDWDWDIGEALPKDLNTPASEDDRNDDCGLGVDMGAYEFHDYTVCQ